MAGTYVGECGADTFHPAHKSCNGKSATRSQGTRGKQTRGAAGSNVELTDRPQPEKKQPRIPPLYKFANNSVRFKAGQTADDQNICTEIEQNLHDAKCRRPEFNHGGLSRGGRSIITGARHASNTPSQSPTSSHTTTTKRKRRRRTARGD